MIPTTIDVRERLRLRVYRTEKFKAETLSVSAAIPLAEDRYLTTLLFCVLGRGCERYPTQGEINRRLDYLFGAELAFRDYTLGNTQVIGIGADFLSAAYLPATGNGILGEVLEMIRELLFHPLLDENGLLDARYVESEKRLQCDAIRAKKNSPRAYAQERCNASMFEGTVRGVPALGTVEQVEAVTPEILTAHWRRLTERMHLDCFYLGALDGETVARTLDGVLGGEVCASVTREKTCVFAPVLPARAPRRLEEALPVTQGQLVMGFRFSAPLTGKRVFAANLFCELLGSSPVSKLFVNVRERLGLCYSCHATVGRYTATATVICGLDAESRALAEREIVAQIDALARGEISDAEWVAARTALSEHLRQMEDNPSAIDRFYFNGALSGIGCSSEEWGERQASVTREEIASLAAELSLDTVFFLEPTRAGEDGEEEDGDEEN